MPHVNEEKYAALGRLHVLASFTGPR